MEHARRGNIEESWSIYTELEGLGAMGSTTKALRGASISVVAGSKRTEACRIAVRHFFTSTSNSSPRYHPYQSNTGIRELRPYVHFAYFLRLFAVFTLLVHAHTLSKLEAGFNASISNPSAK